MITRIICIISLLFLGFSFANAEQASQPAQKPVIAVFDLAGPMGEEPVDNSLARVR